MLGSLTIPFLTALGTSIHCLINLYHSLIALFYTPKYLFDSIIYALVAIGTLVTTMTEKEIAPDEWDKIEIRLDEGKDEKIVELN